MVSDGTGTKVVIVSDTVCCFSLGLEIIPKGMDTKSVGVGRRGVDEIVLTLPM